MMTSLFDQFITPNLLGLNFLPITIFAALLLTPFNTSLRRTRASALTMWLIKKALKHFLADTHPATTPWGAPLAGATVYLTTLNTLGLLPYTSTPTAQLSVSLALAIPLWLGTTILSAQKRPSDLLAHLLPEGTPTLLIPALIIIETISMLVRPLALGVRLAANLTAGHVLLHLLTTMAPATGPVASIMALVMLTIFTFLETAVAMIQAYVFILLLSLYLREIP
uniref:ATP synthase subunit a n=1 Tax=Kinyongia fischeri TaxID=414978 RepID=B7S668_KINFI|nr:ATP synthase F0 subunit 6 [Kinyongia fischeri]ABM90401.1 ATP synthase F0 subunit 6 [Kinyongia fischeri]